MSLQPLNIPGNVENVTGFYFYESASLLESQHLFKKLKLFVYIKEIPKYNF